MKSQNQKSDMENNIFTTLKLTDGKVLCVKECLSGDIFRAQTAYGKYLEETKDDVGVIPFFLLEILLDKQQEKLSLEYILKLSIDDFNSIYAVFDASMKKIPKL